MANAENFIIGKWGWNIQCSVPFQSMQSNGGCFIAITDQLAWFLFFTDWVNIWPGISYSQASVVTLAK